MLTEFGLILSKDTVCICVDDVSAMRKLAD